MTVRELIDKLDSYDAATLVIIETNEPEEFADIELVNERVSPTGYRPNFYHSNMLGEYCIVISSILKKRP